VGLAVLRRLFAARDVIAESANVAPFRVVDAESLVHLARDRPRTMEALVALADRAFHRALSHHFEAWLDAIRKGIHDGDIPPGEREMIWPPAPDRARRARQREVEGVVTLWRRDEAARRQVDEQAVLPGHCLRDLVAVLADFDAHGDLPTLEASIARVPGMGGRRLERYAAAFVAFATALAEGSPPGAPKR
jgi:ribonuclease D